MHFQKKKVQKLVRLICSMLLLVLATTMTDRQETTELPQAMPQVCCSHYTDAGQSTTERTLAHLYNERWAMPVYATGEFPGYHPTHSKHKSLQVAHRPDYQCTLRTHLGAHPHKTPVHHHVIDYYIYTLEHIFI